MLLCSAYRGDAVRLVSSGYVHAGDRGGSGEPRGGDAAGLELPIQKRSFVNGKS